MYDPAAATIRNECNAIYKKKFQASGLAPPGLQDIKVEKLQISKNFRFEKKIKPER